MRLGYALEGRLTTNDARGTCVSHMGHMARAYVTM